MGYTQGAVCSLWKGSTHGFIAAEPANSYE